MQKFDSPEYRRSRGAYMTQCTVEYFVALLATGGFLAKLLTSIGISDALTGVISSISTLAYVQANGNQIAGVPVYGQQVLSVLSFVVVMGAIVFSRKVVSKQSITVR